MPRTRLKSSDFFSFLCIANSQVIKVSLITIFPYFLPVYYLMQLLGSTAQGGLSDVYKRKSYLIFSLGVLLISTISINLNIHIFQNNSYYNLACLILIATMGNADIMGRTILLDVHCHLDKRVVMGWSIAAESSAWVFAGVILRIFHINFQGLFVLSAVMSLILFLWSFFIKDPVHGSGKLKQVYLHVRELLAACGLVVALLTGLTMITELGFFTFFYDQESLPGFGVFSHVFGDTLSFKENAMIAWALPLASAAYLQTKIKALNEGGFIIAGVTVSLLGLMIYSLNFVLCEGTLCPAYSRLLSICSYSVFGLGSGLFLPSLYSLFSKCGDIHHQGILVGWVDSIRTAGDGVTTWFQKQIVSPGHLFFYIIFSGLLFVASLVLTRYSLRSGIFSYIKKGRRKK